MLQSLRNMDSQQAEYLLADLSLSLMPSIETGMLPEDDSENEELKQLVLKEIRQKLKLRPGDSSQESLAKIYEFLSNAISELSLEGEDVTGLKNDVGQDGLLRSDLYQIQIAKDVKANFSQFVRPSHIEDAVHRPSLVAHLLPEHFGIIAQEKAISLYFKIHEAQKQQDVFSLLVIAERKGATLLITNAWRVYQSDIGVDFYKVKSPLEVLRAFIDKYGLEFEVGSQKTKFILYQKIDLPSADAEHDILKFEGQYQNREIATAFMIRISKDPPYVEIALAYIIDLSLYKNDLQGHGVTLH